MRKFRIALNLVLWNVIPRQKTVFEYLKEHTKKIEANQELLSFLLLKSVKQRTRHTYSYSSALGFLMYRMCPWNIYRDMHKNSQTQNRHVNMRIELGLLAPESHALITIAAVKIPITEFFLDVSIDSWIKCKQFMNMIYYLTNEAIYTYS